METHNETKVSNRDRQSAKSALLDELVKGLSTEKDLFGPEGLLTELKGALMERLFEAEMTEHLGHEKQAKRRGSNVRNGYSTKTVETETGPVEVRVPRDREGSFEPRLLPKGQRRLEGFDEKVVALYSRGMTTRDIQRHLRELYGIDVSPDICADGLTGLPEAISAAFPNAVHQTCVVHLIRGALRFVNWKDRAEVTRLLRDVYTAPNADAAEAALEVVEERYRSQYPRVARTFRDRWQDFVPFLSYPTEIRRMLYTTNAIESLNAQLRKFLGQRGPFPSDEAVFKLLYLGIKNAKVHWKRPIQWRTIYSQCDIYFEGRLPA